jgi:hypothetical protein
MDRPIILWRLTAVAEQITLTLPDGIARQVREVADLTQRGLEEILLEWLDRGRLHLTPPPATETTEAQLLQRINLGFTEDWWTSYRALIADRQAEIITETDLTQLVAMSEALEMANVKRMVAISELADLRNCSIEQVMTDLGLGPKEAEASLNG